MLYYYVRQTYTRKSDVQVLGRILEGDHSYRIEREGKRWVFSAILPASYYATFRKCLG